MENSTTGTGLAKMLAIAQVDHVAVAEQLKTEIREGNINPIECMIALKRMSKMIECTTDSDKGDKEIKEIFLDAVRKALDGGKSVDMFGANLRIQGTGTYYDFTESNDEYLNELYRIRDIVKDAIKKREDEIKVMLPAEDNKTFGVRSRTIVQEHMPHFEFLEHGQDNIIYPPIKKGKESVFVTFKK